jgi:hypothetical protein
VRINFGNGVEFESQEAFGKALSDVPLRYYIELEDQAGVNLDQLGQSSTRKQLACYAFLMRRAAGEQITWDQLIDQPLQPNDVLIGDDDEADDDENEAPPDPTPPGGEPSPT